QIDSKNIDLLKNVATLEKDIFPESFYSLKMLEDMANSNEYKILIFDEDVKGYLILHDSYDLYEIMKIGVKNDYRKNKIGKELISFYFQNYKQNLFLEVRESNDIAIKFYIKNGFIKVGQRKNYYSNGETAILMSLERN
ncbi:MAG: GNAT family N-acetyltransferase, partial [Cetobacterium sp.]